MTTTSRNVTDSSAHSATIQPKGQDFKRRLVRESFEKILNIVQQISLHEKSPKLFVIYAHDNESTGLKAYQETVKEYISWFKQIRFNVVSDKSPHGYGVAQEIGHRGASTDILTNQVCLLPRTWHHQNVDYVLVFYSKVLASYMKYERAFKIEGTTYSDAICKTCEEIQDSLHERSEEQWSSACDKIRTVQQRFSRAMQDSFHHVLTETALLSFSNRNTQLDKSIPIILSGDEDWEPELKWQPHFVHNQDTQVRITIKPDENYRQFFKILLEFETLERDRPAIEIMMKCFQDSVELLEKEPKPEEYRSQVEILIVEAMQNLNRQWQKAKRAITRSDIRSRLALFSKLDVASIQRISGETLIRDIHDIDLAVIENPEDKEKEDRQNVSLHNLFDERKVKHKIIRPKRILIQGKPGIGKTTLCRRLMYEYLWNKDLRTKFDLVVRIPARKLERSRDLRTLFFEEYFEDAPNGHKLSEVLVNLVLAHETIDSENEVATSRPPLLILDGLDEVMRYSHGRHALLEKMMRAPAVIITSRFHDIKMPYAAIDLHLEALGLSPMNVEAYLDNKMFIAEDSARQIRGFIEASALVKDMIRVPIHLDIVCYSWHHLHDRSSAFHPTMSEGEISTPTMATIYQSVIRSLWRQDVSALGKMDHGDPMTAETVNAVQDITRLDRFVNMENYLLEELAINMLESDRIGFTREDVAEVIRHWETSGNQIPLSLESKIHKFSLLRSSSTEGYRTFRFVHLTFRDFFAARYVVRSLVQDSSRLRSLLSRYKYNRQYKLFWRFIPGLLTKAKDLDHFFQLLDQEPRDLLGTQHVRLVMHCLHEWPARLKSTRREELVKRLEDWQELECRMDISKGIGYSMAFPENLLTRKLVYKNSKTLEIDDNVRRTICSRVSLSDNLIRYIIPTMIKDRPCYPIRAFEMSMSHAFMESMQKEPTMLYFLGRLRRECSLPAPLLSFVTEEIQKTPIGLLYDAESILRFSRTLPNDVVERLEEWFRSEDLHLARIANSILRRPGYPRTPSNKTINHAVERLIRESGDFELSKTYKWILNRDLPHETIAKILAWLFRKSRRVSYSDLPYFSLHPENVEELGMLLEMCLRHDQLREKDFDSLWSNLDPQVTTKDPEARVPLVEIKRIMIFALTALQQSDGLKYDNPRLPTKILKTVVRILDFDLDHVCFDFEYSLFDDFDINSIPDHGSPYEVVSLVRSIFGSQSDLHGEVINELRKMFNTDRKEAVVVALYTHLQRFDEAYRWALTSINHCLGPEAMEYQKRRGYTQALLDVLGDITDLPEHLVNRLVSTLPEILAETNVKFKTAAYLLSRQRKLSTEAIDGITKFLKSTHEGIIKSSPDFPQLFSRHIFAKPLVNALYEADDHDEVKNLVYALEFQKNLSQDLVARLRQLLISGSTLTYSCARRLYYLLFGQVVLSKENILALYYCEDSSENDIRDDLSWRDLWRDRHLEQFVTSLESFEPYRLSCVLENLLSRSIENITPVYIHGNTLHYQASDGKMKELQLENEQDFRRMFGFAQRLAKLPLWSCIDQASRQRKSKIPIAKPVNISRSKIPISNRISLSK